MILPMTDRGLPIVDGAPACPFVAFEDDRDARATSPDHRHRCYAEVRPAPRALAHQEAYCLASAFPVCPTFQDWARRESARALPGSAATGAGPASASPTAAGFGAPGPAAGHGGTPTPAAEAWAEPGTPIPSDPSDSRRNPPRNWAAPPPWLGGTGPQDDDEPDVMPLPPIRGGGLSGSYADRLAGPGAGSTPDVARGPGAAPPPRWDELEASTADLDEPGGLEEPGEERGPWSPPPRTPGGAPAGRERGEPDRPAARAAGRDARRSLPGALGGPSWERPKRMEAYPTLKTRIGLPSITLPRVAVGLVALVLAAVVLFFLPALLGVGNPPGTGGNPSATPGTSVAGSGTLAPPTATPAPTQQVYVVQAGDTMSRIANRFGVTLQALIDANQGNIPNPDVLEIGQEVIIPTVAATSLPDAGATATPISP